MCSHNLGTFFSLRISQMISQNVSLLDSFNLPIKVLKMCCTVLMVTSLLISNGVQLSKIHLLKPREWFSSFHCRLIGMSAYCLGLTPTPAVAATLVQLHYPLDFVVVQPLLYLLCRSNNHHPPSSILSYEEL